MLYKLHHQKLGNTEKTVRNNGVWLTRQRKFGILNTLGGLLAVFFAARKQGILSKQNDNPWPALFTCQPRVIGYS
jgi:hypothetical protein